VRSENFGERLFHEPSGFQELGGNNGVCGRGLLLIYGSSDELAEQHLKVRPYF
jgi:hypothetical protein